jgi:hypothetical protein
MADDADADKGLLDWPDPTHPEDPAKMRAGDLDPQEYRAALGAHQLFAKMAARKFDPEQRASKRSELDQFLPVVDARRSNHTVLIDGARGSGKTGVMLRLVHDWSELLRGNTIDNFPAAIGSHEIVPVGLLDLEAVPQSANLATRLAGMFERVVAAMEGRKVHDDRPNAPWASLESDTLKSRETWKRFVNAAALEWDQSLERRRANVDPEAYAIEVEQAEVKGLRARETFGEFIDALVKDWSKWPPRKGLQPFFVVPIDDADLNPGRVVELFGLLRTLWHPRVGYLLTGDSGLFERVLTAHFQLEVSRAGVAHQAGQVVIIQADKDPEHPAERLATDYYRKVVSLANRLLLPDVPSDVRLKFIEGTVPNSEFEELLQPNDGCSSPLPGRWRALADVKRLLETRKNWKKEQIAIEIWNAALNASPIPEEFRKQLTDAVLFDGKLKLDDFYAPLVVPVATKESRHGALTARYGHEFRGLVGDRNDLKKTEAQFVASGLVDDVMRHAWGNPPPEVRKVVALDSTTVAAYVLLKKLAGRGGLAPHIISSWNPLPGIVESRLERRDWIVPYANNTEEQQEMIREWNARMSERIVDEADLARAYIAFILDFVFKKRLGPPTWHDLAGAVVDGIGIGNTVEHAVLYEYLACLAAPEWGISAVHANAWLEALQQQANARRRWASLRDALRLRRLASLEEHMRIGQGAQEAIEKIDAHAPGYRWRALVERKRASSRGTPPPSRGTPPPSRGTPPPSRGTPPPSRGTPPPSRGTPRPLRK